MKSNSVIETTVNNTDGILVLVFANGERIDVEADQLSTEICRAAMMHGLKQKLCDAAAMSRNPETGRPATVEEKYAAVKEVYDRLLKGEWNAKREGGGNTGGLLYRALCILYPTKTPEDLKTWLAAKKRAELDALRNSERIAAIIATLKPTKGEIDADALLADLV